MKTFTALFSMISFLTFGAQAEPSTIYYIGKSIVTMSSGQIYTSPYLDARTTDQDNNTLTEYVVLQGKNGFQESRATMTISGNHFTMTESTGTVTGGGELTGLSWNWTFLKAEFKIINSGMRIMDYNFFADSDFIAGHKDFYISSSEKVESLFMQEDVTLHSVSSDEFNKKKAELFGTLLAP